MLEQLDVFSTYFIKDEIKNVINLRNLSWKDKKEIPNWVFLDKVDLDQFFTKDRVAEKYIDYMFDFLDKKNIKIEDCLFIEPSAGNGSFFKLLPKENRIGIDLLPLIDGIKQMDFLDWELDEKYKDKKIIFIGNPPFGYRSWLALIFMNHAAKFADYIFFILPMAFQSDGKGSPKGRVKGMRLVHSEMVPNNSFYKLDNSTVKINALFQVWEKGTQVIPDYSKADKYINIFTVDNREERLCGQDKKDYADFFLQRTYYSQPPSLVYDFNDVKYGCGYGVIIKVENKDDVIKFFDRVNWDNYSNLAAHNCRHISMYHIKKALLEGGVKGVK